MAETAHSFPYGERKCQPGVNKVPLEQIPLLLALQDPIAFLSAFYSQDEALTKRRCASSLFARRRFGSKTLEGVTQAQHKLLRKMLEQRINANG